MLPIDFEGSNLTLTKAENMTDEECASLKAFRGLDLDGNPFICTCWQPSKEDIDAIKEGRPIWISTAGHSFAPMCVYTRDNLNNANI